MKTNGEGSRRDPRRSASVRDALILAVAAAIAFGLGIGLEVFDKLSGWLYRTVHISSNDAVAISGMATLCLALFALREAGRTRAEAARRIEAEAGYRKLVEEVPAVSYTWVPPRPGDPPFEYISPQVEAILGYTPEELLSTPGFWFDRTHAEDRARLKEEEARFSRTGQPTTSEYRMITREGKTIWVRDEARIVSRGAHGEPLRVQGFLFDITNERMSYDRYGDLVEQLPVVVYTSAGVDEPGFRFIAPGIEELSGYSAAEWLADPQLWERTIHPDDRDKVVAEAVRTDETLEPFAMEYRIVRKDGSVAWVRDSARVVGEGGSGKSIWQGVFEDIGERKHAEVAILEAERRFKTLVEQLPAITYVEDVSSGRNIYVSPQIERVYGYSADEWMADPHLWEERLHPDDKDWVIAANAADADDSWSVEYRSIAKDGRTVWLHNEAVLIRDERGNPLVWQGVAFDITEQKEAEVRLRQAESRYRALVEQLPVVVYTDAVDEHSTALYISPRYEEVFGFTVDERLADPTLWVRQVHPLDRDRVIDESNRTNVTGEPFDIEYRWIRKDGRIIWIHDHAILAQGNDGRLVWQGVLADITQEKLAQASVDRRDRILAAVGFAAERFLGTQSWSEVLDEVLNRMGKAAEASRAFVFENHRGESGELLSSQRFEWTATGVRPTMDEAYNKDFPFSAGFERWERMLGAGGTIHGLVRDFPASEHRYLDAEGTLSLAVAPVMVGGTWWGYLGFDHVGEDREWQPAELDALRVAANTLGAAIGREAAAAKVAAAEERYRTLVEGLPAITYIEDAVAHRATYTSPQLEGILGYTLEEWLAIPDRFYRLMHPDDIEAVREEDDRTNLSGEPFRVQYRHLHKDGRWVWIRDEATLIRDDDGSPTYWQGVRIDMTAQKEAEQALSEAEERYRLLVEQLPMITYIDEFAEEPIDSWPTIYVSPQIETILGYTPREWSGEQNIWRRVVHPDDLDRAIRNDAEHYRTKEPLSQELRIRRKDGSWAWIRDEATIVEDEEGMPRWSQGLMADITAQKEAEQALREAEERYRSLIETIPAVTYIDTVTDLSQGIYTSPQVERVFGYTPERWMAEPDLWERGLHPDDHDRVVEAVRRLNELGEPFAAEYRFRHSSGKWVWVRDQAVAIRDQTGRPRFSQGVFFDITAEKEAEQQLREAEERFRGIVEHVPSVIYLDKPDASMTSLYVSPQISDILGIEPELWKSEGDVWLDFVHPDDLANVRGGYLAAIAAKEPWSAEYRMIRSDGREIWVHDETTFLHDEDGKPLFLQGVLSDITERKRAEEALMESERLEREAAEQLRALDEMKNTFLAAVSHELRSPLTSILGLSLTLERQTDLGSGDRTDLLERLAANARKLDRLLRDLLDIDRLNRGIVAPAYRVIDVAALARRTVETVDQLSDRRIEVNTQPSVLPVDPAKVERIIENLLVNATRHTPTDRGIWLDVHPSDGGVEIQVDDDGPGIPADLREEIFEPFRQGPTLSPHAPGTGIGLSLVARFAALHGGRAWVEDRPGGGASFRVFLPSGPTETGDLAVDEPDEVHRVAG